MMTRPVVALAALFLFLTAAFPALAQDEDAEGNTLAPDIIAVGKDRSQRVTVPVTINGSGPYDFMIDTGSERTVVSTDIAAELGLEKLHSGSVVGVAGVRQVDIAYIPELTMGRQSYAGLYAPLLLNSNMGADGILGLDGLQSQKVLFNFKNSTISILELRKRQKILEGEEIIVTARRKSGQLIFTDAIIDGVQVDVVIDTGAHTSIGNDALRKRLMARSKERDIYSIPLRSVTGDTINADMIVAGTLKIDRLTVPLLTVAFADTPAFKALGLTNRPALLLGMDVLRMFNGVSIDFSSRKIGFILREDATIRSNYGNADASRLPRA